MPIGLAIEHDFVRGGLQTIDGGLGQEGVGHEPQPLDRLPVRRHAVAATKFVRWTIKGSDGLPTWSEAFTRLA